MGISIFFTAAGCLPDFPKADFDHEAIIARALMDTRLYIFVTPSATPNGGNLQTWGGVTYANGIAGADAFCMQQYPLVTNLPTGPAVYKALISDGQNRVACTSADCAASGLAEQKDWVLAPNSTYYLPNKSVVMTTNSNGIVPLTASNTGLAQAFDTSSSVRWWTGVDGDWGWLSTANDCNRWSGGTFAMSGEGAALGENAIAIAPCTCATSACGGTKSMRLLCVRQ